MFVIQLAKKYTRFNDIPSFTRDGSWEVDTSPDFLLKNIQEHIDNEGLDIDPDFQRPHVWTRAQQRAYIEFFLRRGRTARVIYLNKPSWHFKAKTDYDDFVLVDGKQRLKAWKDFYDGCFKVFGSYAHEYTDNIRVINTMKLHVNDLQTRAEVLQWYLDFNSGGTPHTNAELNKVRKLLKKEEKCSQ